MSENKPKIRFRNYTPYDQTLLAASKVDDVDSSKDQIVEKPASDDYSKLKINNITTGTSESAVKTSTNIVTLKPEENAIEKELSQVENKLNNGNSAELNIIPKKINWDLKRHIEPKVEKLRKRTQRAIVEILKEKLSSEEALEGGEQGDADDDDDE